MGCTRSKSTETPWCEPITSFGWLGSQSSRIVGKRTYPWYCLHMYIHANSVWWETARENDRYHFTPKQWTEYRPWFWDTENSPIKRYAAHCQKSQVLLTWGCHMLQGTFTILLSCSWNLFGSSFCLFIYGRASLTIQGKSVMPIERTSIDMEDEY